MRLNSTQHNAVSSVHLPVEPPAGEPSRRRPISRKDIDLSRLRAALQRMSFVDTHQELCSLFPPSSASQKLLKLDIPMDIVTDTNKLLLIAIDSMRKTLKTPNQPSVVINACEAMLEHATDMAITLTSLRKIKPLCALVALIYEVGPRDVAYDRIFRIWSRTRPPPGVLDDIPKDVREMFDFAVHIKLAEDGRDFRTSLSATRTNGRHIPCNIHPETFWPGRLSDRVLSYLRTVRLVHSIRLHGCGPKVLEKSLGHNRSVDHIWAIYRRLLHGCQGSGEQMWCSLHPIDTTDKLGPVFHFGAPVWGMLTSEFVRRRRPDLALLLHEERERLGLPREAFILNTLLDGFSKRGDVEEVQRIFAMHPKPDAYTYTTMISTLSQIHDVDQAESMFQTARRIFGDPSKGEALPVATYNAMIHGYLINKKLEEAEHLCAEMKNNQSPAPDAATYNTFLRYFQRTKDSNGFLRYLGFFNKDSEGQRPVQADVYTYTTLLDMFLQERQDHAVVRLFEVMDASGIKPNTATYTAIIDQLVNRKGMDNIQRALRLIDKMEADGIPTNEVTYTSLLAGVMKDDSISAELMTELMGQVIERMKQRDMAPNSVTYNFLIEACLTRPDGVHQAMAYWRKAAEGRVLNRTYFVILIGLIKYGEAEYIQEVVNRMRSSGMLIHGALQKLVQRALNVVSRSG